MARPPHLFINNSFYFITCRTKQGINFFNTDYRKQIIKKSISRALDKYNYKIFAWVILDNHYHLLIKILDANKLSKFIQYINGSSSRWLRLRESILEQTDSLPSVVNTTNITEDGLSVRLSGREGIWNNYWDKCICDERSFWTHFNYIHNNPIKHGCIKDIENLYYYKFCSYNYYLKIKSRDWLDNIFTDYPVIDFY